MWIENVKPFVMDKVPFKFNLHGICDTQEGSKSTHLGIVDYRIKEICADPEAGVIIPGDIEDEDRPSTRVIREAAFAGRGEVKWRDAEKHMAWLDKAIIPRYAKLNQTKYGILGILAGHHWTQLTPSLNSVEYICREIAKKTGRPCPYLGQMSAYLILTFRGQGNNSVRKVVHVQHGEGGGTKAGSLNKIQKTMQGFEADAFIRAHDCQIVAAKYSQIYPKTQSTATSVPQILSRNIAALNLGSATVGYELSQGDPSYVEAKMLQPTAMGWGELQFTVRRAHVWEDPLYNLIADIKVRI